ncbi:uncharacterized protein METZ01_LOCUS307558 [marine metagenome]|uniref:Uncharacterized protein n=1 Tax=marine metagenome TaxID=408172 RepID=A0A382N0E1_9ZZZZ
MSLNITIREAYGSDLLTLIEYNRTLAKETENLSLGSSYINDL